MDCEPHQTNEVDHQGSSDRVEDYEEEEDSEEDKEEEGDAYDDDDDDHDDDEEKEGGGVVEASRNDQSITVTLTDPQVLDCMICYNPLTIPVFQCVNEHLTCSSCCRKLGNKCPFCHSPIGSYRCRAIEKVLQSIQVTCENTRYGCTKTMSYRLKYIHEKFCNHAPCSCPLSSSDNCHFVGSQEQLNKHFSDSHNNSAVQFQYNKVSHITLRINDKFLVLQEEIEGVLFILNNRSEKKLGNVISVSCIGPTWMSSHFYDIVARSEETPLRFQCYADCIQNQMDKPPSIAFLLVPSKSFGCCGQLKLDLCIWRCGSSPPELIQAVKV
ncbi:hypothetical protein EZV62_004917 [Acer yangbiense]|uniref:RING-type E3 ubiquitin transferase n=1 Tax=Acer yangbiense TaxID=1000413 RepID=A0A5C7IN19_9ROSI|nr:hypothetical protein EZV62_004917 [Acer yangbiense]